VSPRIGSVTSSPIINRHRVGTVVMVVGGQEMGPFRNLSEGKQFGPDDIAMMSEVFDAVWSTGGIYGANAGCCDRGCHQQCRGNDTIAVGLRHALHRAPGCLDWTGVRRSQNRSGRSNPRGSRECRSCAPRRSWRCAKVHHGSGRNPQRGLTPSRTLPSPETDFRIVCQEFRPGRRLGSR
jgi:hypothetical protein